MHSGSIFRYKYKGFPLGLCIGLQSLCRFWWTSSQTEEMSFSSLCLSQCIISAISPMLSRSLHLMESNKGPGARRWALDTIIYVSIQKSLFSIALSQFFRLRLAEEMPLNWHSLYLFKGMLIKKRANVLYLCDYIFVLFLSLAYSGYGLTVLVLLYCTIVLYYNHIICNFLLYLEICKWFMWLLTLGNPYVNNDEVNWSWSGVCNLWMYGFL